MHCFVSAHVQRTKPHILEDVAFKLEYQVFAYNDSNPPKNLGFVSRKDCANQVENYF